MIDKFLKEIREKISCPQFGDDHYGEWGILNVNQRRTIKRLIDYMDGQEAYIKNQQAEIERLNNNISAMATTLSNSAKATRNEAIKEFAKMLIDKSKNGTVAISDLPDLVKEWSDNNAE